MPGHNNCCLWAAALSRHPALRGTAFQESTMKHFIALSLCSLALAWALPGHAQTSPAPEARQAEQGGAADNGATGNDGSAPQSQGADNRSDRTKTSEGGETKPKSGQVGDKSDYSGNEGTDTESTGTGSGHGTATQDADSAKQTQDSGSSGSSGG